MSRRPWSIWKGRARVFEVVEHEIVTPGLSLRCHLAPWDRPFFAGNTAAITSISLGPEEAGAEEGFQLFRRWCARNEVVLVSCRLAQERLAECGLLEAQGFRFIELNYRPTCADLGRFVADPAISVGPAAPSEAAALGGMARAIFSTGRLHLDPQVGAKIGDARYAGWLDNAFRNPLQEVIAFRTGPEIIGFAVVERPTPEQRFWSLIGLAPGLAGRGLGRRAWNTLLAHHAAEGVTEVSTSISSQNLAVFNLYVRLGFRFPAPEVTLHWRPSGPIAPAP